MRTLNEITVKELESVNINSFDNSYFPIEHFVENILKSLKLEYYKYSANTGTVYFEIVWNEDRNIKLRLANHKKSNYLGREIDAEIIYNEDASESDIYNTLYQELAWRL
jgi:hypothetical protein